MESNFWAMQVQSHDHLRKEESNKDHGQTYSLEIWNCQKDELDILGISVDRKLTWIKPFVTLQPELDRNLEP